MANNITFKGTTILSVRRNGKVALAGDGQVTLGDTIIKKSASKVRSLKGGSVIIGFAGSTADAMTLFDKFEAKLDEFSKNLPRASVELAKEWRTDKYLRKLEAMMIVSDKDNTFILSGTGDVLEPEEGIASIGSGQGYASASARALMRNTDLEAIDIVKKSMEISSEICIYSNNDLTIEEI